MRRIGFYLGLFAVAFYSLGPVLWQLITSLKPDEQLTRLPPVLPAEITFVHYTIIFTDHPLLKIIFNSLVVATATTALALAVGSLAGFALAKLKVRHKLTVLAVVLATSMFPPIATVSPLYIIINALNLRDTLLALIITYTTFTLPLAIWLLTNFFQNVPDEIYRAARVDGCTPFQAFYRVIVPLSVPGMFATAILVFIYSWNEFLFALTFTSTPDSRTIPVEIAQFPGLHEVPWGDIAAATIVVTLPLIVIALIFQRRIVQGLTAGAVKE